MSQTCNVAVFIGSLRKDSLNRKMAHALIALAPPSLRLELVEIGDLPHYNQDFESDPPQAVLDFRRRILAADAVLFLTPEYNRSVPGVLKNAIDIGSRPSGKSAWNGKPGAVVTVTPGALGGFGANHHLRQTLVCLNVPTMAHPEAYVGGATAMFDEQGVLTAESTRTFMAKFITAFAQWVERNAAR